MRLQAIRENPTLFIDAATDPMRPDEFEQAQPTRMLLRVCRDKARRKNGSERERESEEYQFAKKLAALLDAKLTIHPVSGETREEALYNLVNLEQYDLIVSSKFTAPEIRRIPTCMLAVQRMAWPLNKILLLINGTTVCDAALSWVVRLAKKTGAGVMGLAIVPPVPGLFYGLSCMQQGLSELLSTNTGLGKQTRKIARRLFAERIDERSSCDTDRLTANM